MTENTLEILEKMKGLKKWNIFVVHNSHTDLGYTHRQEWVYKAHQRYIEKAIDIIERNEEFIWTIETYWMVENFMNNTTSTYKRKFLKYVETGNIELTSNYLNSTNLMDSNIIFNKALKANTFTEKYKNNVAIFQDVNSIDKGYAEALYDAGTRYVLGSIHTHHGMFVSSGKQRPFIWNISEGKKMLVLNGEHYMLGNELGLHGGEVNKYTFKDQIEKDTQDNIEKGILRLYRYLKQLEDEGYQYDSLLVPVSGKVIDNAPVNLDVLKTIKKYNTLLPDNININLSRADSFFKSLDEEIYSGKGVVEESGEWPDWWTDGCISTPELVRVYRESQRIYRFILRWNKENNKIDQSRIDELENQLAITAEHTWGHWTSVSQPFSNENSLLLSRKKAMGDKASLIAWTILDEIKEYEGENYIRTRFDDSYTVKNVSSNKRKFYIPLPLVENYQYDKSIIDRYISLEDNYFIVDEQGNNINSCLTIHSSGIESVNASNSWIYLVEVELDAFESKKLFIKFKDNKNDSNSFTSSTRKVGIENVEDIHDLKTTGCKFKQNSIENDFIKITWTIGKGITSIFNKVTNDELVKEGIAFQPIYDISRGASRRKMGRNRRGPNFEQTECKLIGVQSIIDKSSVQMIDLEYNVPGCVSYKQTIRITKLNGEIDVNNKIQKQLVTEPENIYIRLPFETSREVSIQRFNYEYKPWKEQITNSCLDYLTTDLGLSFEGEKNSIAIFTPDNPLIQFGSINFEPRKLMNSDIVPSDARPMIWVMNNYWETNFAGTLEGNYLFSFTLNVLPKGQSRQWLIDKNEWAISFPNYK